MVQNIIRIPVSPRQRNIQTNPHLQHTFQHQNQNQNQKFPIHFVHNQVNKV